MKVEEVLDCLRDIHKECSCGMPVPCSTRASIWVCDFPGMSSAVAGPLDSATQYDLTLSILAPVMALPLKQTGIAMVKQGSDPNTGRVDLWNAAAEAWAYELLPHGAYNIARREPVIWRPEARIKELADIFRTAQQHISLDDRAVGRLEDSLSFFENKYGAENVYKFFPCFDPQVHGIIRSLQGFPELEDNELTDKILCVMEEVSRFHLLSIAASRIADMDRSAAALVDRSKLN